MMRRRRNRGFSLLVVAVLIIVMVGMAAGVALTTQEDLSVAGQDREAQMAFYAAEYAAARGKDFLCTSGFYDTIGGTGWTPLLSSGNAYLCASVGGASPGIAPGSSNVKATYFTLSTGDTVQWQFCVHNNADDPGYLDPTNNTPANVANGDTSDTRDGSHYVVIEGYGFAPNNAQARIAVEVAAPSTTTTGCPPGWFKSAWSNTCEHL